MPRSTRFGLVILAALLIAAGGYTAYWFLVARRIEAGVADWALSQQADKIDVSWHNAARQRLPRSLFGSISVPRRCATARLRLPRSFTFPCSPAPPVPGISPIGGSQRPKGSRPIFAAAGGRTPAKLIGADRRRGRLDRADGGWTLWLTLGDTAVEAGAPVRVGSAHAMVTVPPRPSPGHADPMMALAVEASRIKLPVAVGPLGDAIDELDFGATDEGWHAER